MNFRFFIASVCSILLKNIAFGIAQPNTTTIGDRTFYLYYKPATFDQANQECVDRGGKLAIVRNRTVAAKLRPLLQAHSNCKSSGQQKMLGVLATFYEIVLLSEFSSLSANKLKQRQKRNVYSSVVS